MTSLYHSQIAQNCFGTEYLNTEYLTPPAASCLLRHRVAVPGVFAVLLRCVQLCPKEYTSQAQKNIKTQNISMCACADWNSPIPGIKKPPRGRSVTVRKRELNVVYFCKWTATAQALLPARLALPLVFCFSLGNRLPLHVLGSISATASQRLNVILHPSRASAGGAPRGWAGV